MQNDLSKILRMRKLKVELDLEEGGESASGPRSTLPGISRAPPLLLQTTQAHQTLKTNGRIPQHFSPRSDAEPPVHQSNIKQGEATTKAHPTARPQPPSSWTWATSLPSCMSMTMPLRLPSRMSRRHLLLLLPLLRSRTLCTREASRGKNKSRLTRGGSQRTPSPSLRTRRRWVLATGRYTWRQILTLSMCF
jgi:hypothetical protein